MWTRCRRRCFRLSRKESNDDSKVVHWWMWKVGFEEVGGGVPEVQAGARPCRVEAYVAREAWDCAWRREAVACAFRFAVAERVSPLVGLGVLLVQPPEGKDER